MEVVLYSLAKSDNSTLQPESGGNSVIGALKSPCSLQQPTIEFDFGTEDAPPYNYAHIPIFSRYFFITNWTWDGRFWVAEMSCDTLASFKSHIGASTQYVLRSASRKDGTIVDRMYPARDYFITGTHEIETGWKTQISDGSFVVGIVNSDSNAMGAVSYYAFTNEQFRAFCNALLSTADWLGDISLFDVTEATLKALLNPFQYVVSAMWFPFTVPGTATTSVPLGWWTIDSAATRINAGTLTRYFYNPSFTAHPQAASIGEFMNYEPFTRRSLQFYNWGTIPLDPVKTNKAGWNFFIDIDIVSGVGYLHMRSGTTLASIYASYPAQVGVPITLAQITQNVVNAGVDIISSVGGVIGSGGSAGSIIGAAQGIASAVDNLLPQVQISGTNGSLAAYLVNPTITTEYMYLVDTDNARFGSPICKSLVIGTLAGYVQTENAHIDTIPNATAEEVREIENYMNGGFFYE